MDEKRLFLLDAYALIYRAYYALIRAPRITTKGLNTSAIFGFCNTLDEILRKERPSHIAVCFDPPGGKTFRHEMYPDYKAQRDKQPEDITLSIPYIKEILAAYHIPVIEVDGYEADDVIGTLAGKAEAEGYTTYMMTPDKDYGQLVTDHILMYRPSLRGEGFEVRGPQQVCDRYGISSPRQVIDLLALEGDASDNIPGCPGVGEKTAAKLIAEWGSVENLLDNTDRLKGAIQRKITDNAGQIRFSKELVTIKTDVELPGIEIDSLRRQAEDVDKLADIYRRLEFRTFLRRLESSAGTDSQPARPAKPAAPAQGSLFDLPDEEGNLQASPVIASQTLASRSTDYTVAATAAEAARAIGEALGHGRIAVSTVADGDMSMTASLRGLALAWTDGKAAYIPLDGEGAQERLQMLAPLLAQQAVTLISHDVKRDYLLLKRQKLEWQAPYADTAVAHYILQPEMKHDLAMLALRYLDYEPMAPATRQTPDDRRTEAMRACEAADTVLRLYPLLEAEIEAGRQTPLYRDIELPLIRVLAEMEWTGVRIDAAELDALSKRFTERLDRMEEEAYTLAGVRFNIASPMQVGEVLFERLKIDPKAKRTKRGAYSTTEEVLEKLRTVHPIVDLILQIRALRKLLATYVNALPALVNPVTNRIHTSYNQTVTATGRISSTNPNLQNIPVRTDDGREIRRAFVPSPGNVLLSADYSQIELRLMAELSHDSAMTEAFLSGADIHRATAARIYHRALGEVTDTERRNAKTANFGIIYGISAFGLSERLAIPRSEAKELIEGYFMTYPGVKEYMDNAIASAREQGYVTTLMGRRRMLPDISSRNAVVRGYAERNAINAPLQGSAADIIKIAMVNVARRLEAEQLQTRMIMQVHDELIFDVVPSELERIKELVADCMASAYRGTVPLEVSMGTGANWLEAH